MFLKLLTVDVLFEILQRENLPLKWRHFLRDGRPTEETLGPSSPFESMFSVNNSSFEIMFGCRSTPEPVDGKTSGGATAGGGRRKK